ncbi:MAG: hypothetical protein ABIO80_02920 [Sphingomicrobium sp.]
MKTTIKLLAGAAGFAALAAATPATAQTAYPYGYSQPVSAYGYAQPVSAYGYAQPYGTARTYGTQPYGYSNYAYGQNTSIAQQQCSAAVQNRLANRQSIGGIIGAVLGVQTSGRVLGVTSIQPRRNGITRVHGLASSGRYASNAYSPYGVGAYGALGYNSMAAADLSFRCDVDYRGYVRDIRVNRR